MFSTDDTIVAIATPPGRGGIGVVRLSGPGARQIAATLLDRPAPLVPRVVTLATVGRRDPAGPERLDQVLATSFPAPASYTGDDVIELSAHGSPVVLEEIVAAAMRAGARLAEPGEFTLRGFLNGRIDLVQAEAVGDLIEAVTPAQARLAYDQLEGTLSDAIRRIDAALFDLAARLEASLDFPDEGYHFIDHRQTADALIEIGRQVDALLATGRRGRVIREGRHVVIVGRPNAGKSSIFNRLVGAGRAIVTEVPGTTRDLLTETINLDGVPVRLVDTAGIRATGDVVEVEGVARARGALTAADLVLVVFDRSCPFIEADGQLLAETPTNRRLLVVNKVDRRSAWPCDPLADSGAAAIVETIATVDDGVASLRTALQAALGATKPRGDATAITNVRHLDLLERTEQALTRAAAAVATQVSEEFVLADLQAARTALEEITGRRTTEELLQHIFSRFCIGK